MTARARFHRPARSRGVDAAVRRRRRGDVRRARRRWRTVRVQARPVADAAAVGRRPRRAPVVLDLRAGGSGAADRRPRGARTACSRRGWCTRSAPATRSRCAADGHRSPRTCDVAGHHVLIAAGSGITPVLSIAASLLSHSGRDGDGAVRQPPHGHGDVRRRAGGPEGPRARRAWSWCTCCRASRARRSCSRGRLDVPKLRVAVLLAGAGVAEVDHWWLCGPFGMVTGRAGAADVAGRAAARACTRSCSTSTRPPAPVRARAIRAWRGSPQRGHGSAGRPLHDHDAAARHRRSWTAPSEFRPDLPFACKGGVCGTCRARVTEGKVDLRRNFALEESEVEAGFVLTCQSYPVSEEITVDFDA